MTWSPEVIAFVDAVAARAMSREELADLGPYSETIRRRFRKAMRAELERKGWAAERVQEALSNRSREKTILNRIAAERRRKSR